MIIMAIILAIIKIVIVILYNDHNCYNNAI